MFGAAPSSFPQGAAVPVFAGFSFPPEFNSHGFAEQQSNSLHLTGVAGLLGDRINGVYMPQDREKGAAESITYAHASTTGITALYVHSTGTWSIFDSDTCVAYWLDSSPSASPELLHRFGLFHEENRRYDAALCAFQAAASAGHIPSHFCVFSYLSDSRPGVARDALGAFAAAQVGAAAGNTDCVAAVAFCHLKGVGTDVNVSTARELCSRIMSDFSPMVSLVQGLLHLEAEAPVTLKKRSALPFLQIAASAEVYASASFNLAVLLSEVGDEFCDIPQAIHHLRFASSLGMQSAKDLLAQLGSQGGQSIDLPPQQSSGLVSDQVSSSKVEVQFSPSHHKNDSKFCFTFCQIHVRTIELSGNVHEIKQEPSSHHNFELSPNAKACLAPNVLVLSTSHGAADNVKHTVSLHFPEHDDNGVYSNPAPVLLDSDTKHIMVYYSGARACHNCSMHGPSSQTGQQECSVCFKCSTCCDANPTCSSGGGSVFGSSLSFAQQIGQGSDRNCFHVTDMLKEHKMTFSGAYVASQSVWSNGFPVYFQVPLPNQKHQFAVEFHMRPSSSTALPTMTPNSDVGVWELKSKDKVGSSECIFNFDTKCGSAQMTLPPVTLEGDDALRLRSRIEMAAILATLRDASVKLGPDCTEAYIAFQASQKSQDAILDTNAPRQHVMKRKHKPHRGNQPATLQIANVEPCNTCVWLDSKTGTAAVPGSIVQTGKSAVFDVGTSNKLSSIAVNVCLPMSIIVEKCQGQNAIFVNGVYALRNAYYGKQHFLFVYQSVSFGTILGCLVRKNRVSCAISATAVQVFMQSKDRSCLQPFAFPRDWNLLATVSPPKPAPRVAPAAPAAGLGFGAFGFGAAPHPPAPQAFAAPRAGGGGIFGGVAFADTPQTPLTPGDTTSAAPDASSVGANGRNQPCINCSEMIVYAVEKSPDQITTAHVWPSLQAISDALKNCSVENKKPLLSHIWRHLIHRCGSSAAAVTDLDIIFHLSSESNASLDYIQELSDYVSATLETSISDCVHAVSDSAIDENRGIFLAIPASVASFLRTRYTSSMKTHLQKMYHSIFGFLSSRCADGPAGTPRSVTQTRMELFIEVARVVGEPFGLDAADALRIANPFSCSFGAIVPPVGCQWDVAFCSGNNQDGWRSEPFTFTGATVRFPNGPVHCPTLEKFGFGLTVKGYLNFQYGPNTNSAWSVGLVPVSSLRDSSYLWNSAPSVIGYGFGGHGSTLRQFPTKFVNAHPLNVFVGLDAESRTCSFYINGSLISSDSVPESMFPCVIAVCGHSGSTFSISTIEPPGDFGADSSGAASLSFSSLVSGRPAFTFGSILSQLMNSVFSGSVGHCHKIMLDSALHALIGEQDHKFLKAAFVKMKKSPTLLKLDRPSKFAIVLDKFTSQCLEHLRTSDPELSSFTAFGLLSFITKVDQDEAQCKTSADMKFLNGIFLPVCHRILNAILDATECVSFISDLDTSTPLSAEYFNSIACTLLHFMQTDEGAVAARILMESTSNKHVESFFSALVLQLSSLPYRIKGSISLNSDDSGIAMLDSHGSHLANLVFKTCADNAFAPAYAFNQYQSSKYSKVCVEVQQGNSKPSTHVVFSSISPAPSSLNFSLSLEKQGIVLVVESVPVCLIKTSINLLRFSKFVCSVPSSCTVEHDSSYFGSTRFPDWLTLFVRSRLHQCAQDFSPVSGPSVSTILKYSEMVSVFAENMLPARNVGKRSSFFQRAIMNELIDISDEPVSHELISRAVDIFIDACRPYLSLSSPRSIHQIDLQEKTPCSTSSTPRSFSQRLAASGNKRNEIASEFSPLSKAFMNFAHFLSLASSNCEKTLCTPTACADIQFQSSESSSLASDQQASNCVQIVYKKPASSPTNPVESRKVRNASRKICSFPISLASFCAKICVKDLDANDVACVELNVYTPGSNSSNRETFQLYSSGILLHGGICVGHIPQFARKQWVSCFVTQMGTVSFVADQKVILEFPIVRTSGTVCRIAVCYGGESKHISGPPLATDLKGLFTIELLQSTVPKSFSSFYVVQAAMQKQFPSLSDRLSFASFAYTLSSILSPSVSKQSCDELSLIQRSADKIFFDLLCADGLASLSSISEEQHLIHAVRILCDWLPEQPKLLTDPSIAFFKHIQPGSSASLVMSSVIQSQIKSNPTLPAWCLGAISCFLCESFMSSEGASASNDTVLETLQSHINQAFADWNLCLPPSDARSICLKKTRPVSSTSGCGPDCRLNHASDGNCLLCGRDWGHHAGHDCMTTHRRGSWPSKITSEDVSTASDDDDIICSCSTKLNPETGLDEFIFNLGGTTDYDVTTSPSPQHETEEQREFREFQEFKRSQELKIRKMSATSGAGAVIGKHSERCSVCFDQTFALFGCTDSFGIFPGSTVSLKDTEISPADQSALACILQPGQTGFVVCTYRSSALIQGPERSGIVPCEMLQLVSCVVSSLFFEAPNVHSISESVFFANVMTAVVKLGVSVFPEALKNSLSTRSLSMFKALFSSFGPKCTGPFQFPFREQSDFVFLCQSVSLFTGTLTQALKSCFSHVDDLTKLIRFLSAFGSVNWEETMPRFNFLALAPGIYEISQETRHRFVSLLFSGKKNSNASNEVVMCNLISSLSPSELSFMANILKHSTLPSNFFIPFLHYVSSNIVSGHIAGVERNLILSFLQLCIPPGAFLQQRHALLQLSVCLPNQSNFHSASKNFQVSRVQRWIVDLLLPHLGASCAATIDGQLQSILPHFGWCDIVLPGHSAFRLAVPEGLVFDTIFSANAPLSIADIEAKLPLQIAFVLDAITSLLSKQLIAKTGLANETFVVSSHFVPLPANEVAEYPSFNCMGEKFCEIVHAIFSHFKSSPSTYEHELFRELCCESIDNKHELFSCSFVAFALSKLLTSGKIARHGPLLLKASECPSSHLSPFEPREFHFNGVSSCIRSMTVVVCDESSSIPSLSLAASGTCESFPYEHALSLIAESFTRIHQDTGIDLREISECFASCKGDMVNTIHTLMFDPKFAAKRRDADASSNGAAGIRFVEEGLCPTCLCDKILVALPCDHRYCQECLQEYIQDSMANSSTPKAAGGADRAGGRVVTNICCPSHVEGCAYMIKTTDVKFLATSEYASFIDLICRQSARAMASGAFPTVTCVCGRLVVGQTSDCEYECECGRISSIGDVKNSNGGQNWIAHPFSTCLQEERWKEYTQVGSEARQSLMRTKKCPSCGAKTTKCGCQGTVVCNQMDKCPNEACDHMQCGVCSSHWCWVCGRLGSTEARCTYPKHLITQTKELFKEAEAKVQEMENAFFSNSWRAIRFDPAFNTATVLSVAQTPLPFKSLAKGDRIIAINGQRVVSSDSAQKALSIGWAPGHFIRIEYQRKTASTLLVCPVPTHSLLEQDAFVLRRSRIVSSVSDIASTPPLSGLEKSRALLDKVISEVFKEPPQPPIAHSTFGLPQVQHSQSPTIQPPVMGKVDVITNAALDPRIKSFLQVAGCTSDEQIRSIVADLVEEQKSVFQSSIDESTLHAAHFCPSAAGKQPKSAPLIVKRVCASTNVRVRCERSLSSAHIGTLRAGAVFLFSEFDGEWAKLSLLHSSDLQNSPSCVISDCRPPYVSENIGFCITNQNGIQHFEDPSETERASLLTRFGLKSGVTDSATNSKFAPCYVWKSWAFSVTTSPRGQLKYITFWNHNDTLKPKDAPQSAALFGRATTTTASQGTSSGGSAGAVAGCKSSDSAADAAGKKLTVTRAVELCDKFAGSIAILDKDQEAWLFSSPSLMVPIDTSSATPGPSIQNRPWLLNLTPTFCSSISEFCTQLLSCSSDLTLSSTESKSVSVMLSVELDAVLHRYVGDSCLIIHGNGDWATCHVSQIPASFKETAVNATPVDFGSGTGASTNPLFTTSIPHVGSWDGCGGNIAGVSCCAGNGNCSSRCYNCGARSHWTCCGSSDKESKTCSGPITNLQAIENDRIFRLVVREQPIKCVEINGLSGGQFSIGKFKVMPSISSVQSSNSSGGGSAAPASGSGSNSFPAFGVFPTPSFGAGVDAASNSNRSN